MNMTQCEKPNTSNEGHQSLETERQKTPGGDLCHLPGLPTPQNPLVRQVSRFHCYCLCRESDRPHPGLHTRHWTPGRPYSGSPRHSSGSEDDTQRCIGRMPTEGCGNYGAGQRHKSEMAGCWSHHCHLVSCVGISDHSGLPNLHVATGTPTTSLAFPFSAVSAAIGMG